MGRFGLAFKAFFRVLSDDTFAEGTRGLMEGRSLTAAAPAHAPAPTTAKAASPAVVPAAAAAAAARSEALTLLSVLQREARLLDFLKENITPYSNEQVGAAVRDVHRDASASLERMFALQPVMSQPEGASVEVPTGADAARVRLVGNVAGSPPFRGTLRHAGWEATKLQLPEWTGGGDDASARVVAPAEVEL
jgi:hypothetical protein